MGQKSLAINTQGVGINQAPKSILFIQKLSMCYAKEERLNPVYTPKSISIFSGRGPSVFKYTKTYTLLFNETFLSSLRSMG